MTAHAQIEALPERLTSYGTDPGLLGSELLGIITTAIVEHPRSLQVELGPSEVGHPCARRIGYKLLGFPEKAGEPNWKATVGTAIHTWLEDVFLNDNPRQPARAEGFTRWLVETKVTTGVLNGEDLDGSCDLFDRVTGTVVDWKSTGPTALKKYRALANRGLPPRGDYRAQAHLYGRGWVARGQRVERVAIMVLPRNGELREAVWWSEAYDEQVALDTLARANGIATLTTALGTNALPMLDTAASFCSMCPYFLASSADLTRGCPGDPGDQPRDIAPVLSIT